MFNKLFIDHILDFKTDINEIISLIFLIFQTFYIS